MATRRLYHDAARKRFYTKDQARRLTAAERRALKPLVVDEAYYYSTRYGSPLAYSRALDLAARRGLTGIAGRRVLDFGYGKIGHLRLMAQQGAHVVDVDPSLPLVYGRPGDQGPLPGGGALRLVTAKNVLKAGYIHPARPVVPPRQSIDIGLPDARFVGALFALLKPKGLLVIYNLYPRQSPPNKPYKPWADGKTPFPRRLFEAAGFEVLDVDHDDTAFARRLGRPSAGTAARTRWTCSATSSGSTPLSASRSHLRARRPTANKGLAPGLCCVFYGALLKEITMRPALRFLMVGLLLSACDDSTPDSVDQGVIVADQSVDSRPADGAVADLAPPDLPLPDLPSPDQTSSDLTTPDLAPDIQLPPGSPTTVSAGTYHTCAIIGVTVKCWGWNHVGQLGLGDTIKRGHLPNQMGAALPTVDLGPGRKPVALALGWHHSCAAFNDGALKCWGSNVYGQLGLGSPTLYGDQKGEMGSALATVDMGSGLKVLQIVAGEGQSCGRLHNGAVKCWGHNTYGKLGLGDTKNRGDGPGEMGSALPAVKLGTGRSAKSLAAGRHHVCALLDNNSVKCWGRNLGQLGLGDTKNRGDDPNEMGDALPAVALGTGRTAKAVAAGDNHSCAILDNDQLKCWGTNYYGELGLGDTVYRGDNPNEMGDALPTVALGTGRKALAVVAGGSGTCALLDNGATKCWGSNTLGELGLGQQGNYGGSKNQMGDLLLPLALGTGRSTLQLVAGESHRCTILDNGLLKCWGWNSVGQLGLGDTNNRGDNPKEMGDLLPAVKLGP